MIRLKNETQMNGIKKSCELLAKMYNEIIPLVHAGMSTKDVDNLCVSFIKKHGGKPAWYAENFPGAVCISINDEVIHGIPSKHRILHDGDIVSLDAGIDLDGFISDSAVTIPIGNISERAKQLISVTEQCLEAGIKACKVGNRISDISKAVFDVADKAGFGVVRDFCGHGVGLSVHEDPSIPNYVSKGANPRIQPGMVLAIEPMINLGSYEVNILDDEWTVVTEDGSISSHAEHTVGVFSDHIEIFTKR